MNPFCPNDCAATALQNYRKIAEQFLSTPEQIQCVLSTVDHAFYGELATFLKDTSVEHTQHILNQVHSERYQYTVPCGVIRRTQPKAAHRVKKKVEHSSRSGRSAFADWIACRMECEYSTFVQSSSAFRESLPDNAVLVWRTDYEKHPDIVQYGYAYVPGLLAIMEIQILEPFAAWVFSSNSKNKHFGDTTYATFQESEKLYSSVKASILAGDECRKKDYGNVVQYYERARIASGGDPSLLDREEIDRLEHLLAERFKK